MSHNYQYQQGFGLPMALFVITVLAVILATMASMQNNSASSSGLQTQSHRALFSAESGIEAALNLLIPPDGSAGRSCSTVPFYSYDFLVTGLNGCSATVSCSVISVSSVDYYTLVSTGQCGSGLDASQKTIEIRIK